MFFLSGYDEPQVKEWVGLFSALPINAVKEIDIPCTLRGTWHAPP
jgi:hypothetical protein